MAVEPLDPVREEPVAARTRGARAWPWFAARELGPATIFVLVVAQAVLWMVARPQWRAGGSYVGQLLGAEAVLLLSIALVLISTLPWVEAWFDGIDRAAIWHRRVAIAGLLLLAPHIAARRRAERRSAVGRAAGRDRRARPGRPGGVGDPAALAVGRAAAAARPSSGGRATRR